MNPSDRVREFLPTALKAATELARQNYTTNSFAPSFEEFKALLEANPHQNLAVITEAYMTASLMERDEEHTRRLAWEKSVENHMSAVSELPIWPPGSRR